MIDAMNTPIYRHPSGTVLHTMTSRIEGFKELMYRTLRNGGDRVIVKLEKSA